MSMKKKTASAKKTQLQRFLEGTHARKLNDKLLRQEVLSELKRIAEERDIAQHAMGQTLRNTSNLAERFNEKANEMIAIEDTDPFLRGMGYGQAHGMRLASNLLGHICNSLTIMAYKGIKK